MEGVLLSNDDPFVRGLQSRAGRARAWQAARSLLTDAAYRAKIEALCKRDASFFLRHESNPALWSRDPCALDRCILTIASRLTYLPQGTCPVLETTLQQLQALAVRTQHVRAWHLPDRKILRITDR